jgi:hypothetical protein
MPASPAVAPRQRAEDRVARHIQVLGVLWIVRGGLKLLGAAAAFFFGTAMLPWMARVLPGFSRDGFVESFIPAIVTFGAGLALVVGAACVAAGIGLLQREPIGRPLALVMGFLSLLSFPIGTALGIYTLWVLLPAGSEAEYRRLAHT